VTGENFHHKKMQLLQEVEPRFEENKQKAMKYLKHAESIGIGSRKVIATEV